MVAPVLAGRTVACLVVPNGTHRPEPLAAAVRAHHPDWEVVSVWCGDPHLRPVLDGTPWADVTIDADDERRHGWERTLAGREAHEAEWLRALDVCDELFEAGSATVVLLWVGAVAVLGDLTALLPAPGSTAVLVPRATGLPLDDGLAPDAAELVEVGRCSTSIATFSSSSAPLRAWLATALRSEGRPGVGRWWDLAVADPSVHICADPRIGVSRFRWGTDRPALLELDAFDPARPWSLDADRLTRARIDVVGAPDRAHALALAAPQVAGQRRPLRIPGAITVDAAVRAAVDGTRDVPPPWSAAAAFRHWLEPRYWLSLHGQRPDLARAFPYPRGDHAEWYTRWCETAFTTDAVPFLVAPGVDPVTHLAVPDVRRADGVNVVGYLTRESSLGDVGRRLLGALDAAHAQRSAIAFHRTGSPEIANPPACEQEVRYATTLALVNADQLHGLLGDHPELFRATERMIGYWFWELDTIPAAMRASIDLVDEIWAGSTFVADAFRTATDKPVRVAPIPLPPPVTSGRARASFPPLADLDGRFAFAVVFDHFSVTERKNPVGVIEAFKRAFAPDEGPVLVVKSMNAEQRWPYHQQVLAAIGDRPDIRVWDVHLERDDHMAFIAAVDALVALHRSEGLGLHLAEAMWLDTPVIATRYSGNLDFMDDSCSILIDAELVPVTGGQGVYPPTAHWADPDLDQAAAAMRRLVDDPALVRRLAVAGKQRMQEQPTQAEAGRSIAGLLGLDTSGMRS